MTAHISRLILKTLRGKGRGNMNTYVFGKEGAIYDTLKSACRTQDRCLLCPDTPLEYSFGFEDVVILVSDDISLIRKTHDHLSPEVPLLLVSRCNVFDLADLDNVAFFSPDITSFLLRTRIDSIREGLNKYKILESRIVGKSREMCHLRRAVINASHSTLPVHVFGPTGTGKTMSARTIHRLSRRGMKELVYLNAASLNTSLSDSDLFGHSKGAYTNAGTHRAGLLACAHESTFLIDEVENLSLDNQAKLLDTLEGGNYRTLGKDTFTQSSFRLITASQKSQEQLLDEGRLRHDFYQRISSQTIEIPPLSSHTEDIPLLVEKYKKDKEIPSSFILDPAPLMERQWNGNVRELFHYLDAVFMKLRH